MNCDRKNCPHYYHLSGGNYRCQKYQNCELEQEALIEVQSILEDIAGNVELDPEMEQRVKLAINKLSECI